TKGEDLCRTGARYRQRIGAVPSRCGGGSAECDRVDRGAGEFARVVGGDRAFAAGAAGDGWNHERRAAAGVRRADVDRRRIAARGTPAIGRQCGHETVASRTALSDLLRITAGILSVFVAAQALSADAGSNAHLCESAGGSVAGMVVRGREDVRLDRALD